MAATTFHPSSDLALLDAGTTQQHPIYGDRPLLRGRFHQAGALLSIPVGLDLVRGADGAAAVPTIVYVITAMLMFSASASYHRLAQSVGARFWMRRVDHAGIFVHVAGAATPVAVLGVGGRLGVAMVVVTWLAAVSGAIAKLCLLTADHDPCPWLFPLLGALPLVAVPAVAQSAGAPTAILLVASIATYAVGAVVFTTKSPDPIPTVFGYHEVWHVFTLIGGAFQLGVTSQLITTA